MAHKGQHYEGLLATLRSDLCGGIWALWFHRHIVPQKHHVLFMWLISNYMGLTVFVKGPMSKVIQPMKIPMHKEVQVAICSSLA